MFLYQVMSNIPNNKITCYIKKKYKQHDTNNIRHWINQGTSRKYFKGNNQFIYTKETHILRRYRKCDEVLRGLRSLWK